MKKSLLFGILFAGCMTSSYAQSDVLAPEKNEKKIDHYFGVQLNNLIRQIFSFNNSTAADNTNPFLFTYNINSHKSGWGLRAGLGATFNSSSTNDNVTKRTSDIKDIQFRLGIEKRFSLSEKWTTGVGLDAVIKNNNDNTTAVTNNTYLYTVNTQSTITSTGGGAMAWMRYSVTDKILIGTETSFYYLLGKNKQTIISSDNTPAGNYSETHSDDGANEGKISVPVVFYLTVKF